MFKSTLAFMFLFIALTAAAQKSEVFIKDSVAIGGYDPVAFFTESKPVKGNAGVTATLKGVNWYFSSEKNRKLFTEQPDQYLPQYGGYCAYGAAEGHKAPTEVNTWTIIDNKLYFNYNQAVKRSWMKDQQALIKKADANWDAVRQSE